MASTKRRRRSTRRDREARKRAEIDADFARMGTDPEYKKLCELLDREFAYSDWEALLIGEAEIHSMARKRPLRSR
jgi:hypothetical protein